MTTPWPNPEAFEDVCEALEEAVTILSFAFDDGALSPDAISALYVNPYGALADMKSALSRARNEKETG